MPQTVHVHLLPKLFEPEELRGGVAVVIDVLRASTTIIHALAAGAKAVIPCEEVEDARRLAANLPAGTCLLGGERDGVKIEGFDLDNSPLAYTEEVVAGKTIIFTTTNGTRALARAKLADEILIGGFVSLQALLGRLREFKQPVHLVCAGTQGEITAEDVSFAGAVAWSLADRGFEVGNDGAQISSRFHQTHASRGETLFKVLCNSTGGRNLLKAGFEADIQRAAEVNRFEAVPRYYPSEHQIRLEA